MEDMKKRTATAALKQQVYETVKTLILSNQLKPGQALLEDELGAQFGLSRTPIREILTQLGHERIVKRTPYMGTFVTQLTREDVQEIYEIRGALESLAVRLAVARISERELEDLERIFRQAREEIGRGGTKSALDEFRRIHDLIVANAGNVRLQTMLRSLDNEMQRIMSIVAERPDYDPEPGFDEKREILLALQSRDPERAAQLITQHYTSSIDRLVQFFPDRSSVPEAFVTPTQPAFLSMPFSNILGADEDSQ